MSVNLSEGNTKMGEVLHVNLPPRVTCNKTVPCWTKGCYARKAWRMYSSVRAMWGDNWEQYKKDPVEYFNDIMEQIEAKRPDIFRWHSAGDIPDAEYLKEMFVIAHIFPDTKFMCFTKQYEMVMQHVDRRFLQWNPPNLTIILSAWPGYPLPRAARTRFPIAWMRDPKNLDSRIPKKAKTCNGRCDECLKCWGLLPGESIVFDKH